MTFESQTGVVHRTGKLLWRARRAVEVGRLKTRESRARRVRGWLQILPSSSRLPPTARIWMHGVAVWEFECDGLDIAPDQVLGAQAVFLGDSVRPTYVETPLGRVLPSSLPRIV